MVHAFALPAMSGEFDLYAGGYAGYATGSSDMRIAEEQAGGNFGGILVGSRSLTIDESLDLDGVVGGTYAGAAVSLPTTGLGEITLGIEGFYEGAGVNLTEDSVSLLQNTSTSQLERKNAKGVAALVGFRAFDSVQLFARGGYVHANYETSTTVTTGGVVVGVASETTTEKADVNLNGYEVGGGAEYAANDWLAFRFDYGYRNFEKSPTNTVINSFQILDTFLIGSSRETDFDPSEHYFRGGVVFHFGSLL